MYGNYVSHCVVTSYQPGRAWTPRELVDNFICDIWVMFKTPCLPAHALKAELYHIVVRTEFHGQMIFLAYGNINFGAYCEN